MGLILNRIVDPGCTLGIWNITEDYTGLRSRLELSGEENQMLQDFRNHNRKLEWLSVRVLAEALTGGPVRIIYNHERKPYLHDNSWHISISHSHDFTAIILCRDKKVGIDTEFMSHRISRISDKFINDAEIITRNPLKLRYHLYIHWCAKEALYKICDRQGLNFRDNLIIESFIPANEGKLKGWVRSPDSRPEAYDMSYFRIENYIIVWCSK